MWQLQLTATDS